MFPAKYVGSFEISDDNGCRLKRLDIVRRRLETVKLRLNRREFVVTCKSVIVVVSASGVRTCSFDQKVIHSCHSLKRISYATCDPDYFLFSFIARHDSAPTLQRNFDDENFRVFGANCFTDPEREEEEGRNDHLHYCCSTGQKFESGFVDHHCYKLQSQQYCHVYRMENREKVKNLKQDVCVSL
uniref:PID domain-containing protein n=1 Tax=Romanomermis culicivorax TaxID=13658 RepID=A0A915K798_ROMCU